MLFVEFAVPGKPVGKARPRVTRWGAYTPKATAKYEQAVASAASDAYTDPPEGRSCMELAVEFRFEVPESYPKRERERALSGLTWPKSYDIDNCVKSVMDALNGIIWEDDKQVVRVTANKVYTSGAAKTVVVVRSL